jgi:hypothetical protein
MFRVCMLHSDDKLCAVAAANRSESERFLRHYQKSGEARKCMKH